MLVAMRVEMNGRVGKMTCCMKRWSYEIVRFLSYDTEKIIIGTNG